MARAGTVIKTYASMLRREAKQVQLYRTSQAAGSYQPAEKARNSVKGGDPPGGGESPCWVPHPSNGIYVPKGNERMMDDVPKNADSLNQTYWLRNDDDGEVEKPDYPL